MAEPVRARRLTPPEGQKLQRIVRRGSTNSVRYRRAMKILAPSSGNTVPVIARLVQAHEDEELAVQTATTRPANPSPAGRSANSPPT
ncbi:hypothetical protein OUQ99_17410 [Streptomonospora nanhaiensis]|uniref:Transposase n=1 Tax=Streptomonospora nanhaiensis TaxID=1323731 RepID=A0ABY6YFK3_9ACTN|nr:hypothetical protein [Streptomonospora nanhaiensis]WAE71014.1 hypothetical protein OUQ99_17410 [Streptomonospora nanhaiensis]